MFLNLFIHSFFKAGYLTNCYRGSHQKELKIKKKIKSKSASEQSADRPEIELKVYRNIIESVVFGKIYGVT